jgi:DNA-binding response OmpR family regulator
VKVLVVEDDDYTRKGLAEILAGEGYQPIEAADGTEALELIASQGPDLVCLDIMMPGVDGYEVCRRIRAQGIEVPVIFISAKGEEIDKVVGLELGADDFIVKPFGVREVVARIRAVTRRCLAAGRREDQERFEMGDLEVFPDELRARRGGRVIDLSLRDVKILRTLHQHAGRVVDRNTLFNECWGLDYLPSSRTLDQHIAMLRKRIERDPKEPVIIRTVYGVGYRYDGPSGPWPAGSLGNT